MDTALIIFRRKHTSTYQDVLAYVASLAKTLRLPRFTHAALAAPSLTGRMTCHGVRVFHGAMTYCDETCLEDEYADSVFVAWSGAIRHPAPGQSFLTCVTFVKWVLNIDAPGVQAPDELYDYLLNNGGEEL